MTIVKLLLLVMICIVGYANVSWTRDSPSPYDRMSPFLSPTYEVDGIFLGAASIFFAYTGFDAIGNAAEEVRVCVLAAAAGPACSLPPEEECLAGAPPRLLTKACPGTHSTACRSRM